MGTGQNRIVALMIMLGAISLACGCKSYESPTNPPEAIDGPGVYWTEATANAGFSARSDHTSLVFNSKMWVIGGLRLNASGVAFCKDDVWYSADGVAWTEATAAAAYGNRGSHTSVVFDDGGGAKMWLIAGGAPARKGDVWYSSDGANWTQATGAADFSARMDHSSVVFNNKMWVIGGVDAGGLKNDVWSSADGITWAEETAAAAFSPRLWHRSIVYGSKMWVIGGRNDVDDTMNDAWYSSDGVNWSRATSAAGFCPRDGHALFVHDNRMWVIGGYASDTDVQYGDVWSSSDGADWRMVSKYLNRLPRRILHTCLSFNGKMWTIAGRYYQTYSQGASLYGVELADVHYSPE